MSVGDSGETGRLKQRWRAGRLWRCLVSNSNSEVLIFTIAGLPEPRITGTTIAHLLWASSATTASRGTPKEPCRGSHSHCTHEETGSSLEVPEGQRRLDSGTLLQSPGDSPMPIDIPQGKGGPEFVCFHLDTLWGFPLWGALPAGGQEPQFNPACKELTPFMPGPPKQSTLVIPSTQTY